jgi:hypothetical protein
LLGWSGSSTLRQMLEGGFRNGALWINFSEVEGLVCEGMRDSTMSRVVFAGKY